MAQTISENSSIIHETKIIIWEKELQAARAAAGRAVHDVPPQNVFVKYETRQVIENSLLFFIK